MIRSRRLVAIVLWMLITVLATSHLAAGFEIEGVTFPETYQADGTTLERRGAGLYRYLVFKVFVSALYLRPADASTDILSDIPKRLVIHYFYDIKAEEFVQLTEDGLKKNLSADQLAGIRPMIDQYNTLYTAVKPGDEYSLTYLPGRGTELALNGKPRGIVKGPEFAAAIYTIWLGPKPLSDSLKTNLLGR